VLGLDRYKSPVDRRTDDQVKVRFRLDRQDEDWPPVESEGVWATPSGAAEYRLDNVPWFARGIAFGDLVSATPDEDGVLWVDRQVEWSGRYTIRVIPLGDRPSEDECRAVIDAFQPLGAECEGGLPAFKIVALDIPPTARLAEIKTLLDDGQADGRWGYDEGCIDSRWRES
jgi:hypothetical protein